MEKVQDIKPNYKMYALLKERSGLSSYAISRRTGVGEDTLSRWKSGQQAPKYPKIRALAEFFQVETEVFYDPNVEIR